MNLLNLKADHLRILNESLNGQLSSALLDAAKHGGDLELLSIRERPDKTGPSRWTLVVRAGDVEHRFPMDHALAGLGVTAHIYVTDLIDELKADLAASVCSQVPLESMDECSPWSCNKCGEPS